MLIGKEVTHEYRGRGTVIAVGEGEIVVRFGKDYDLLSLSERIQSHAAFAHL